jgi:hypothetical protein
MKYRKNNINKCNNVVNKNKKLKFINMTPEIPNLLVLITLHQRKTLIRSEAKLCNSPVYKAVKQLTEMNKSDNATNNYNL